ARQFELEVLGLCLSIAGEPVTAERKGKRGELAVVRLIRKAIGTRRKDARKRSRPKQILLRIIGLFEREEDALDPAFSRGEQQVASGDRLKSGGIGVVANARIEAGAIFRPGGGVNEGYRDGLRDSSSGQKNVGHGGLSVRSRVLARRKRGSEYA